MKKILLLSLAIAGYCCNNQVTAQTEWQVGNTTLTEYDLVTGLTLPWEITWGPDDYIWCTTRPGKVLRIDPETGNYTEVLSLTVTNNGSGEPGLLGMCLNPDWENYPLVYLVYNYNTGNTVYERLVSYEWNGNALVNPTTLINNIPGGYIHNGSRIIISPDNKILMTTGDTGDGGDSSQDIEALNGKVLRINLDGSIPADNPDPTSYVYTWGHRNGQGLCVGPNGLIYESEHGQNNSDEFNVLEAGRNYGWPHVEGACNTNNENTWCTSLNVKEPLKEWSPCRAVNGIEYYNHPAIPEWQNCVLMAVLGGLGSSYERMAVLHMSEDGLTVVSEDSYFSEFNRRVRDICVNPYTGAVYVAFNGPSYPGSGPNAIKEFVNEASNSVQTPVKASQNISLFPNPADTNMNMEFSPSFIGSVYQVYSFKGDLVKEEKVTSTVMTLNVSEYASGNYFLVATSAMGTVSRTFVVK